MFVASQPKKNKEKNSMLWVMTTLTVQIVHNHLIKANFFSKVKALSPKPYSKEFNYKFGL
jgi:hypothetical protein